MLSNRAPTAQLLLATHRTLKFHSTSARRVSRSIVNNLSSLTMSHPHRGPIKVASDMFQIKGDNYLLVTDYHSKFYLVEKMQSTTSTAIANKSAQWFSMFGPPLEIVTSNGPQYVGQPYEDMCSKWNIKHTTTSPRHRQSNDVIEAQVRTVKGVIQKCAKTGNDMLIALQQHRCTPLDSNVSSPSEILFNRPIRTTLPSHHPTLMQQTQQLTNEQLLQRRDRMIRDHDRHAGPSSPCCMLGSA